MPPGSTGSCLLPYPGEALELHLMEGSEKKQETLALTFAYSRLLGVVSLESWLYFCFSYKWKLFWHIFMIKSMFTGRSYRSHLAQVLWCCGSLFLQPCYYYALLKLVLS